MNDEKLMSRKEKLVNIFEKVDENKKNLIEPILDEVIFLEQRLKELRQLPFIRVNPNNPEQQKITAAGKQYKELAQSYLNAIKVLSSVLSRDVTEDDDEFDNFMKNYRS